MYPYKLAPLSAIAINTSICKFNDRKSKLTFDWWMFFARRIPSLTSHLNLNPNSPTMNRIPHAIGNRTSAIQNIRDSWAFTRPCYLRITHKKKRQQKNKATHKKCQNTNTNRRTQMFCGLINSFWIPIDKRLFLSHLFGLVDPMRYTVIVNIVPPSQTDQ